MTRRRFSKLQLLEDGSFEARNTGSDVAVMPWGGSKGPTLEAYGLLLEDGADLGWYYTMFLNPLPPALLEELRSKRLVLVPELNYQGQFSRHTEGAGSQGRVDHTVYWPAVQGQRPRQPDRRKGRTDATGEVPV